MSLQAESTTSGRQSSRVEQRRWGWKRGRVGWGDCDGGVQRREGHLCVVIDTQTCGHM